MECVQELASAEAGIFRDVLPVAPPETLPETLIEASIRALLTLAQSVRKLRLVVAVIARGAEERGRVVDGRGGKVGRRDAGHGETAGICPGSFTPAGVVVAAPAA